MSSWEGGSTRRWRKIRAAVLADNLLRHGGACNLQIPGTCAGLADCVHHQLGRGVTGDDPRYLVASCTPCNSSIGDPTVRRPAGRPLTRW